MKSEETLTITQLDASVQEKINKIIEDAEKKQTKRVLNLKLNSTTGITQIAISILNKVHKSEYIDLHEEASGALDLSGTVLLAGGEIGHRLVQYGTTLQILESEPYDKKAVWKSLKGQERVVFNILKDLTKKPKLLFENMKTTNIVDSETARKLNLVDEIDRFRSKYNKKNRKKNGEDNVSNES